MKFPLYLLFIGSIYSGVDARTHARSLVARQNKDSQVQASFAKQGLCFSYLKGGNRDKELGPCKIWCEKENEKQGKKSTGYGVRTLIVYLTALNVRGVYLWLTLTFSAELLTGRMERLIGV